MVAIAERVKYPRNWDLWYYERSLVVEYVDYHRTGNARRKEMTQATGGKLPFDGQVAYPPGSWRMFPFRQAAIECAGNDADTCKKKVHNILVHAEDEMLRTFDDISKLLAAFQRLIANGGSLIVIEHNLDVVEAADWVIDLGPEGGAAGGKVVAVGPPEQIARSEGSYTGHYLKLRRQ